MYYRCECGYNFDRWEFLTKLLEYDILLISLVCIFNFVLFLLFDLPDYI